MWCHKKSSWISLFWAVLGGKSRFPGEGTASVSGLFVTCDEVGVQTHSRWFAFTVAVLPWILITGRHVCFKYFSLTYIVFRGGLAPFLLWTFIGLKRSSSCWNSKENEAKIWDNQRSPLILKAFEALRIFWRKNLGWMLLQVAKLKEQWNFLCNSAMCYSAKSEVLQFLLLGSCPHFFEIAW